MEDFIALFTLSLTFFARTGTEERARAAQEKTNLSSIWPVAYRAVHYHLHTLLIFPHKG